MRIEINQIIRSRRKTMALIIQQDGTLTVRAPLMTSETLIQMFVQKNTAWIQKKQAQVVSSSRPVRHYVAGELFPFLGREYPLEMVKGQKTALILDSHFKLAESSQGRAEQIFHEWYREQARQILTGRVRLFAERYQLHYQKIRIGSARTRWGSCSTKGGISFSWRLILAPPDIVDYVVVHELAHTLIHNHTRQFWKQVEGMLPDYEERRKWLRRNGQKLIR